VRREGRRAGVRRNVAGAALALAAWLGAPESSRALQIQGNAEVGLAARLSTDGPHDDRILNAETRLLVERQWYGDGGEMLDLRVLAVQGFREDAAVEVRQASVYLPLGRRFEITAGRQVLSWGPAQFEFVNDRFAKDFEAFFVGRDPEYLKAPNDAVRARSFLGGWTLDLVLAPIFQHDRMPDPRRFPVLDPATGEPVADPELRPELPKGDLSSGEAHLRLDRHLGRWETALYGYRGFTGGSEGVREAEGGPVPFHPAMAAVGVSVRGPVLAGLGWLEAAYEDIREGGAGADPRLPPDRWVALGGTRWSPTPTRTWMLQASAVGQVGARPLQEALVGAEPDDPRAERVHYRLQGNVTQSFLAERLEAGVRLLWGITEGDAHWRARVGYELSDDLVFEARYHGFAGDRPATRFGLLRDYDLFSVRLRYHL
jgi:hypothetical protein